MPDCRIIKIKRRKYCAGDLDRLITINSRTFDDQHQNNDIDVKQVFTPQRTVWAGLETTKGRNTFFVSNLDVTVSHIFIIRWFSGLTAEAWIQYAGENYDILEVENLEERNEWALCYCNVRGDATKAANYA